MSEKLMGEFTENYFEKLFYFCLKKTGNSYEAEDLTSDIALNIVATLKKGTVPINFSAWVWKIAHNRYSLWAKRRRMARESVSEADISEFLAAEDGLPMEEGFSGEDLKLLRRELSFIASDYRDIVVAYYIDDRSVGSIAKALGVPEGTVKSKLFRARKKLKEGMKMAREFGAMSYRPEEVSFINSCFHFGANGEPWSYLNRMLCKNILLAVYRTPSTAEELAVELGVALPYMEDELRQLTNATLLSLRGRKYETNFFIFSARQQEKIFAHLRELAGELTAAVTEALEYKVKCLEENGCRWHEGYQPYEDMKWAMLMREADAVDEDARKQIIKEKEGGIDYDKRKSNGPEIGKHGFTKRPNGGEWDIAGFEEYHGEQPAVVGLNAGVCNRWEELHRMGIDLGFYQFGYLGIAEKTPDWLSFEEAVSLAELAKHGSTGIREETLQKLAARGFVAKREEKYYPAFWVSFSKEKKALTEEQAAEYGRLREKAKEICMNHYLFGYDIILREIPEFLKEDMHQIAFAWETILLSGIRGAVLEEAHRRGWLSYEGNDRQRMLGIYMVIDN